MVRYKLLKHYPSLHSDWEAGMIVKISEYDKNKYKPCDAKYTNCFVSIKEVENNPEFWKREFSVGSKVKDLTYGDIITKTNKRWLPGWEKSPDFIENNIGTRFEIVENKKYKITTFHWATDKDTLIKYNEPTQAWPKGFKEDYNSNISEEEFIKTYLESGLWKIHTVIYQDKSFSVGDKILWNWSCNDHNYFTIKSFQESAKYGIEFSVEEHDYESWFGISGLLKRDFDLRHYKETLFTTVDGVDIFEGDKFYILGNNHPLFSEKSSLNIQEAIAKIGTGQLHKSKYEDGKGIYWLRFSTKENAEAYILRNKPCLSVEEVLDALEEFPMRAKWSWDRTCSDSVSKLESLVKKKIND